MSEKMKAFLIIGQRKTELQYPAFWLQKGSEISWNALPHEVTRVITNLSNYEIYIYAREVKL